MVYRKYFYIVFILISVLMLTSCKNSKETDQQPEEVVEKQEEVKQENTENKSTEVDEEIIKLEGHKLEDESVVGLDMISGKKINFIAIWQPGCGPCKVQLSAFNELAKKYTDVGFIGISISEKSEEIKKEMDDLKLDFLNYRASEQFLKSVEGKISKTPTMLVLDSKGKLLLPMVEGIGGESNSAEGQVKYIESIIEKLKNVE